MDARVQDYLDDKLQCFADFETLDALLESVQSSQSLFRKQLNEARDEHHRTQDVLAKSIASTREKAGRFSAQQHDIDNRLRDVTSSSASDEAIHKFEAAMDRLKSLDILSGYLDVLLQAERLVGECRSRVNNNDEAALAPYLQLRQIAMKMDPLQQAAEGAAPHLLDHVRAQQMVLSGELRLRYSQDLERTLKALHWPKASKTVPIALQTDWFRHIGRLLQLQRPDLESGLISIQHESPAVLLPLAVMVTPLQQRFEYHFSGSKETNRLDKPEFFFNHILELINGFADFLTTALQPLLVQHFRDTPLAAIPAYVDAISAFITAVLPILQRKLLTVAAQLEDNFSLLSHLVQEVIKFDAALRENFAYAPLSPGQLSSGLSQYLLNTGDTYERWLGAERDFAMSRYQSIIDDPNAGELDYDSVASDTTKPSKAAIRVNDLLETITERYRPLPSFSQKLRFLIDIQIAVFDKFHQRLHSSLEAYMTMTSSVARTVHGISREEQRELQGLRGMDRLCRIFGSAEYLERAMRDWSDDVFFLELWQELQQRSRSQNLDSRSLGSMPELQAKTSAAVGANGADSATKGALFDETADAYHRLRVRSEGIIVETLTWNVREALKPYSKVNTWASLLANSAGGSLTSEIEPTLRLLNEYLAFLGRALGRLPLRRVTRQLCHVIQSTIWDQVIMRHSFSTAGADQVRIDVDALIQNIARAIGLSHARSAMRKLSEGLDLLCLPIRGEIAREQPGSTAAGTDDGDAAWDDDDDDADGDGEDAETGAVDDNLSLFGAERLIFKDNKHARIAMDKLGIEILSETDARQILGRRIELAS